MYVKVYDKMTEKKETCYCCQDPLDLGPYYYYLLFYRMEESEDALKSEVFEKDLCGVCYEMTVLYLDGLRARHMEAQDEV